MRRLVYVSRSCTGNSPSEVDRIVLEAKPRNAAAGVTGLLWFDGENFAQALEGEHDDVARTMNRIEADARHTDVTIVSDYAVAGRVFGSWTMIRPDDDPTFVMMTAFLVGHATSQRTIEGDRLRDILFASID